MENKKKIKLSNFTKFIIGECIILAIAVLSLRSWVFPYLAHGGMKHVVISTHALMIGITSTLFSIVAILVKRKWKSHKKFILPPAIFMVFGYILLLVANELNF